MPQKPLPTRAGPRRLAALTAACFSLLAVGLARGEVIIALQDVTSEAGATGAVLDILLTNTGPADVEIGGFTFELMVGSTDITFSGVTTATSAPYIFGGQGLFGPDIGILVSGQNIMASDVFSVVGSGTMIGAGVTMGLGRLVFDVSSGASGVYAVNILADPATTLSDFDGNPVQISALNDGSITIQAIPEPSTLLLTGIGGVFLFLQRRRGALAPRRTTAEH